MQNMVIKYLYNFFFFHLKQINFRKTKYFKKLKILYLIFLNIVYISKLRGVVTD